MVLDKSRSKNPRDSKRINEMFNGNFTTSQILKRCEDTGFIEEIKGRGFDNCTELAELMQSKFEDLAEELPLSCFLNAAAALFNNGVVHFYESLGRGFGQSLFDKDSVLTSKSKDNKKCAEENRFYNWGAYASKLSESKKKLKEMTQAEFNRLARERDKFRAQTDISPAEKNNLYADIKDFEEEFRDLQDTAERLPDSYIDQVCSTSSYPFDVAIDEVQNVEDWCSEVEEFLKDDINNWGIMKEANLAGMLARRGSRMGGTKPVKVECCLCGKKDLDENMHFLNKRYYCDKCFMSESDKTYKAKAGKKWLKGDKLVKSKASADSFESKTEPTQRLNQMKKDGKLDKDVNIDVVEESIFDFAAQNQPMYRFAKQKHDATGAIRKHSGDPYWVHPEGVAKIAASYGGTDVEIQAAMAHDTLEDTNCSYEELEEMFGDEVASIVREITNDTEEVDRLGKEQYINLELINLSHPALFVKLCDMYYNQMDFPAEAQKRRMIKNINYLLANREDDLNENEIALIEDILQTLLY